MAKNVLCELDVISLVCYKVFSLSKAVFPAIDLSHHIASYHSGVHWNGDEI